MVRKARKVEWGMKASPGGYRWFVVLVLLLAYTVSFIDRQVIGLLVEPIKRDLVLTDTQFSVIAGFAFALFYATVGLLLGRAADRWNRRNLILVGVLVWVPATAACGYATSFATLFLARALVAVGEAALNPAAYSLLIDYFPQHQRAQAMSLYTSGVYLGSGLAFLVGGTVMAAASAADQVLLPILGPLDPWRATFVLVALPGILVFGLMLAIREPSRSGEVGQSQPAGHASLRWILRHLGFYAPAVGGLAILAVVTFVLGVWVPAIFVRTWEWSAGQIGLSYGAIILTCGIPGMLLSGMLADALSSGNHHQAPIRVALVGALLTALCTAALGSANSPAMALAALAGATFFVAAPIALGPAILLPLTPNRLRGQVAAASMLCFNLIGLGLGPLLVALLTDHVFADAGMVNRSVGIVTTSAAAVGAFLLWIARPALNRMAAET